MKKTLLAASLFAGFFGTAQAQTSVTLYGVIDTGIEAENIRLPSGTSFNTAALSNGGMYGNRWGMKGKEDLGSGNQLFFDLESGFDLTSGSSLQSSRLFGRDAVIGLENPAWGMIRAGRSNTISTDMFQDAPGDPTFGAFGVFNLGSIATSLNTYRTDNQIGYMSPTFSGIQFGAGYSFNVSNANTATYGVGEPMNDRAQGFDAAATYTNGPLYAGIFYGQTNPYATSGSVRQFVANASYDFTVVRVYGAYVRGWNGLSGQGMTPAIGTSASSGSGIKLPSGYYKGMDQSAFMLGVSAPVGEADTVYATYQHQTLAGGGAYFDGRGAAQNIFSVGSIYRLSKQTKLYGTIGYVDGLGNISGQKETAAMVGVHHLF